MNKMYTFLTITFFTFLNSPHYACDPMGITGFFEANDMKIPATDQKANPPITEERFHQILNRIEKIYKPIIQARGKNFLVLRNWGDEKVNAYAQQFEKLNLWIIKMMGGLARHPLITEDAFATIACHEIGHHLGGAPKARSYYGKNHWASGEGQSDYFAVTKCMRKYMEQDNNLSFALASIRDKEKIPPIVLEKCSSHFIIPERITMCIRTSLAGQALANIFVDMRNKSILKRIQNAPHLKIKPLKKAQFETPDLREIPYTNNWHPDAQCRLDTYFQGSLCNKSSHEEVSSTDPSKGTCTREEGYEEGIRPLCWYRPPRQTPPERKQSPSLDLRS